MSSSLSQIISALSHVTILLFVILVAILSFWTNQRVRKASSKHPFGEDDYSQSAIARRHSEMSPVRGFPFPPIVKRAQSVGSLGLTLGEKRPRSSSSYGWRTPPLHQSRSFSPAPSCVSDREDTKSELSEFSWDAKQTPQLAYWLSDEEEDSNSPTGSLLDNTEEGPWNPSAAEALRRRASSGRRILTVIGLVRACLGLPALLHYTRLGFISIPEALVSNFDILICDVALSTGLAIAPALMCLIKLSFRLPLSWEHHVYHSSMILVALPLVAGLQLAESPELSLFRLSAPIFSIVAFLIARDQAQVTYWAPLAARQANHASWL